MADEAMRLVRGTISTTPDPTADINYFMNYALVEPVDTTIGAYFTHQEKPLMNAWRVAEQHCDFAVYMADRYKPHVDVRMKIYPPGIELPKEKRINDYRLNVGVVGRIYKSGRKGEKHIVKIDTELKNTLTWDFMGEGWTSVPLVAKTNTQGYTDDRDASLYYDRIDVLLSVSEIEGGSVPHLEAAKLGVPIISFDVGNSELWSEHATICETVDDMIDELKRMAESKYHRYQLQLHDWKWFGKEHAKLFARML